MRVILKEVVKDKKGYCCGGSVCSSDKYKNDMFICGETFGKDKIVLCNGCYKRLMDGND